MGEFGRVALGFPTALFGAALLVVVAFWLLVLLGAAEHDSFHSHVNAEATGMGGVPVTVPVSLMVVVAWFGSLTGSVLVRRWAAPGPLRTGLSFLVLALALLIAWSVTRLLVLPLRGLFADHPPPSRLDFVGLTCTIRTGSVSFDFGQAEAASADGSTALLQVRVRNDESVLGALVSGSTALLYAYDDEGEFFWVTPFDTALDPRTST